ncbi:MAG: hypothetical protein ACYS76_04370 [Planctomycetota bacterium]|jgi:hypothetical protein
MKNLSGRLQKAEKKLKIEKRPVVIEAVVFGGELPQDSPSAVAGNGTAMRYVGYDDIMEEKQWPA